RKARQHEAGRLHEGRRAVDVRLRDHGGNEGDVVHAGRQAGQQAADVLAALAVLLPRPGAFHVRAGVALEQLDLAAGVELRAVALDQLGLVIEGIDLAGGPGHEQLHDAPSAGAVVQAAVEVGAALAGGLTGEQAVAAEQGGQRDAAEAAAGMPEKMAAIESGPTHPFAPGFESKVFPKGGGRRSLPYTNRRIFVGQALPAGLLSRVSQVTLSIRHVVRHLYLVKCTYPTTSCRNDAGTPRQGADQQRHPCRTNSSSRRAV